MSKLSRWKEDFPIQSGEDSYVTRREFTKFLGLTSLAFLMGTCAAAARQLWKRTTRKRVAAMAVTDVEEVAVGGYKLFHYPSENDPCILLRLDPEKLVAFNQRCTHLACPVYFDTAGNQLVCPCHKGFFSAEDGSVMSGPPKRPLEQLTVSLRSGRVWVELSEEEYS